MPASNNHRTERFPIKVKAKFSGQCRQATGTDEIEVEITEGTTAATLCLKLAERFPELEDHFHSMMIAVNAQMSDWELILSDGDEIDFLSTLGGG